MPLERSVQATATMDAPAIDRATTPVDKPPTETGSPAGEKPVNPYIDTVNRRLRTLRKRLAKIQANEEAQKAGKALDKDQLASIARKGEVEVLLKELEEIEKQFEAIDAEQQRNEKKLAKKRRNEELKAMQLARERELERQREVLELVYILRHLSDQEVRQAFLTGAAVATPLDEEHLSALDVVHSLLFPPYDPAQGLAELVNRASSHLFNLLAGAEEPVGPASYAQVSSVLNRIRRSRYFDLEVARQEDEERRRAEEAALAAAIAEAQRKAEEEALSQLLSTFVVIHADELPPPSDVSAEQVNGTIVPVLQFMVESEIEPEPEPQAQPAAPAQAVTESQADAVIEAIIEAIADANDPSADDARYAQMLAAQQEAEYAAQLAAGEPDPNSDDGFMAAGGRGGRRRAAAASGNAHTADGQQGRPFRRGGGERRGGGGERRGGGRGGYSDGPRGGGRGGSHAEGSGEGRRGGYRGGHANGTDGPRRGGGAGGDKGPRRPAPAPATA